MTDISAHQAITLQAEHVRQAQANLEALIAAACPGPHRFTQHRDHRRPWCSTCRYLKDGNRTKSAS